MYALFFDKSAIDSQALQAYVSEWKMAQKIAGEDFVIDSVDQITTICAEKGKKYSTIIAVGDEKTFDTIVSESRHFNEQAVLSYIPTSNNLLAKRIGVKDYKDACEVIAQRKIIELTALSIGQYFFLFHYALEIERSDPQKATDIHIQLDKSMSIRVPADKLIIHNRHQELLPHSTGILLEAYQEQQIQGENGNLLKIATSKIAHQQSSQQQLELRIPANTLQITAQAQLKNNQLHPIASPVKVGLHKKPIRLIVKKGQELQAIMSPGLIL